MRYGICMANIGTYADPRVALETACAAEDGGWDGVFVWDHLGFVWDGPAADPWVTLSAIASSTTRVRLGTAVTPVARRRPHVLAHQVATLDLLSSGRVIFAAGLGGVASEFARFGESADPHTRAQRLDEGLDVLRALWSGTEVNHRGTHYTVEGVTLAPAPVQQPLPIWIGGNRGPSLRRAARWDGWCADSSDPTGMKLSPNDVARAIDSIGRGDDFDVAVLGQSDRAWPTEFERVGATWWLESVHDLRGPHETMLQRIGAGPPSA